MEHVLTKNGMSFTCLCCHSVLASREEYARIACEVEADNSEAAPRRDTDSAAR
jgi:hypothetical protein